MSVRQGSASFTIAIGAIAALIVGAIVLTFMFFPIISAFFDAAFWGSLETTQGVRGSQRPSRGSGWSGRCHPGLDPLVVWITTRQYHERSCTHHPDHLRDGRRARRRDHRHLRLHRPRAVLAGVRLATGESGLGAPWARTRSRSPSRASSGSSSPSSSGWCTRRSGRIADSSTGNRNCPFSLSTPMF